MDCRSAAPFLVLRGVNYFKKLVGDRVNNRYLVYSGDQSQIISDIRLINYRDINTIYEEIS